MLNLLSVELERVFGELEAFLDESGKLTNAATLLTKNLLGVGSADNDLFRSRQAGISRSSREPYLCASVSHTDIAARVTLLGQFASEELVELGAEDTVSDELSLLADLSGHFGVVGRAGGVVGVDHGSDSQS